jgi:hypothetical protein
MDDPTLTQFIIDNVSLSNDCIRHLFDLMNGKQIAVPSLTMSLRRSPIPRSHRRQRHEIPFHNRRLHQPIVWRKVREADSPVRIIDLGRCEDDSEQVLP